MPQKRHAVETRMVSEYLKANYSQFSFIMTQPLGLVSDELMAKVGYEQAIKRMRPFRPEVDAVVILPRYLVIIEAKVWNVVNGLAKLPLYKSLVPFTPELKDHWGKDILMEIVVGWTNANLEIMARDMGVKVVVYDPPWLDEEVNRMHSYWTKEYRDLREQKLQLREYFGIE